MARTDIHLDAMLRHLGAAYYESLHGRATRADVTRAVDTVEEHLNEQPPRPSSGGASGARRPGDAHPAHDHKPRHSAGSGWSRSVSDIMTTSVVTVDRITPYKEIARLLAEHRISGLPVVKMGRTVVGVVTEADLLAAQANTARRLRSGSRWTWRPQGRQHPALTAGELMTTPAVTIGPGATIPAAARLMNTHHVRRLPVVDEEGRLLGVISRRDLLSVFLRPDDDIAEDIRKVLDEIVSAAPGEASVSVRNGIVTLTGTLDPKAGPHGDLIPLAIRLMWDVDGVVAINDRLGEVPAARAAGREVKGGPAHGSRPPHRRKADR
jgi:CBS domain-containing protein